MVVKNKNMPVIDFDHVRALNEYIDSRFLNSTLQSIRGGTLPKPGDVQECRINNTPFIVSVYPDDDLRGGKQVMLLHSIHRLPNSFNNASIEKSMSSLDINNDDVEIIGGKKKVVKKTSSTKPVKKKVPKNKGGSEDFEQNHDEVEELGGVNNKNIEIIGGKKTTKKVKIPYAR